MSTKKLLAGLCCAVTATLLSAGAAQAVTLPERAPAVFDFTKGWNTSNINSVANGNARIYTAEQAVRAGLVHEAFQARLPAMGATSHWWN